MVSEMSWPQAEFEQLRCNCTQLPHVVQHRDVYSLMLVPGRSEKDFQLTVHEKCRPLCLCSNSPHRSAVISSDKCRCFICHCLSRDRTTAHRYGIITGSAETAEKEKFGSQYFKSSKCSFQTKTTARIAQSFHAR